ncbi:MAG: metallophosphoesterase family protein [Acidobacteria bacterium]|nr:metallophosphoesterase family protein [Acidobacteriota bacterium]
MRYLVISDIHSNLEALQVVLQYHDYDQALMLGDIVGYGANPEEVVQLVRELRPVATVRGNHDKVVAGLETGDVFVSHALAAALWTRQQLSVESLQYVRDLPVGPRQIDAHISIAHGSPRDEDEYLFPYHPKIAVFDAFSTRICFFGHTHIPTVFYQTGEATYSGHVESPLKLTLNLEYSRYLINPGSVGQPRDGDPRAAFLVLDTNTSTAEFFRVDYDIQTAQRKIREAGLPDFLSERLARGV